MTRKRKRFSKGVEITPENIEGAGGEDLTREGELGIDNDDNKLKARLDSATRSIVSEDQAQTLENKTIDGTAATGNNTVTADADDITYNNATSGLTATELQAAMDELDGIVDQDIQDLSDHLADTIDSHDASSISYVNTTSGLTATELQAAVDEVDGRIDTAESDITDNATNLSNHLSDAVDAHDASAISFDNTASSLAATDAQSAIDEVEARLDTAEGDITGKATLTATTDNRLLRSDEVAGTPSYVSEISTYPGTIATTHNIDDGDWAADTFTTTSAINLSRIDLELNNQSAIGTISVSIYENNATDPDDGTLMGISDPVDMTGVPGGFTTTSFIFSTPVTLDPATEYYYVVKGTATSGQTQLGFKSGSFTNQKRTLNFGSTWAANTTERGIFEVFSSISATSYAIQESGITVDDLDAITGVTDLEVADIKIDSTGISSIAGNEIDYDINSAAITTPVAASFTGNNNLTSLFLTADRKAQGFNSSASGNITDIDIIIYKSAGSPTGPIVIDIYDDTGAGGSPGSLIGTSDSVLAETLSTSTTTPVTFTFTGGPALTSGNVYYLSINASGTNISPSDNVRIRTEEPQTSAEDPYVSNDNGSSWGNNSGSTYYHVVNLISGGGLAAHSFTPSIGIDYEEITASGANAELTITKGNIRLTNAALESIAGLTTPATQGFQATLTNVTGNDISLINDATVSGTKILTGTKKDLTLKDQASIRLTYDNASNTFYVIGGTGADSGQGGINYILNPDAESGVDGWQVYADAAQATPEDGDLGSPTITLTSSETDPLRGDASFLITKDAADRQGEGISYDFTIDNADKARMLSITFDYSTDAGYSFNDFNVFVYDVDNAEIITVTNPVILNSENIKQFKTYFQTSVNSNSYRLILHNALASPNAYTMKIDNVRVGPLSGSAGGEFISDWVDFTLTPTSGITLGNATVVSKYKRTGSDLEVDAFITLGSTTSVTGNITFELPPGLSKATFVENSTNVELGRAILLDQSLQLTEGIVVSGVTSNTVDIRRLQKAAADNDVVQGLINATEPHAWGANDTISFKYKVPIQGWETGVLPNEISEGKLHTMSLIGDVAQSIPYNTTTKLTSWATPQIDESGAWDAVNSRYIVQETGNYQLHAQYVARDFTDGDVTRAIIGVEVNGLGIDGAETLISSGGTHAESHIRASISRIIPLNAGDYVEITAFQQNVDSDALDTIPGSSNYFSMTKLNNLASQITPAETVAASYKTNSGQLMTNNANTIVLFEDKDFDSHNAYNITTGVYTVPVSGKYQVSASNILTGLNTGNISYMHNGVYRNGTLNKRFYELPGDFPGVNQRVSGSVLVELSAGDEVTIQVFQGSNGANRNLLADSRDNFFTITKVGN